MVDQLWLEEERDPRTLLAHPRNPRTHSAEQVAQIRASIREYGFTNPALITHDGRILAGHGRTEAGVDEGMDRIPVRVRNPEYPLTLAQELALVVADNKLALNAGWDYAVLTDMLKDIGTEGMDLALTGFDELELRSLIGTLESNVSAEDRELRSSEPLDSDMWPVLKVSMPRAVMEKWNAALKGKTEQPWEVVDAMLDLYAKP